MADFIEVQLTEHDIERAKTLARKRDAKKLSFGHGRHGNIGGTTSEDSHYKGLTGEVAVCKIFDIEVDSEIYDDHGDDGYDIVIGDLHADVKTAAHGHAWNDPILKVSCEYKKDRIKLDSSDIFISCSYNDRLKKVRIWGWVDKDTLKNRKPERMRLKSGRPGPLNYHVKKHELQKMSELGLDIRASI